jgi:hypothetical protein
MKYADLFRHGYGLVDVDAERVQGEIWHVPTVDVVTDAQQFSAGFVNESGANGLRPASGPSPARSGPDPA